MCAGPTSRVEGKQSAEVCNGMCHGHCYDEDREGLFFVLVERKCEAPVYSVLFSAPCVFHSGRDYIIHRGKI